VFLWPGVTEDPGLYFSHVAEDESISIELASTPNTSEKGQHQRRRVCFDIKVDGLGQVSLHGKASFCAEFPFSVGINKCWHGPMKYKPSIQV
jgi:hypothetical protein